MWNCRKCSKPVFFAERKQSLGFDWHPYCLRCEECGKRLNPGQHAEHKGVPFCHHPCYGALFGPQLFGHGTRNECHTSFGKVENRDGQIKRSHLEARLKLYNSFHEGKPSELKSREANGRLILEGVLRIYWGVQNTIHLKEEDDSRMIAMRRQSCIEHTLNSSLYSDSDDDDPLWRDDSPNRSITAQSEASESPNRTTVCSTPAKDTSTNLISNTNDSVSVDHEGNEVETSSVIRTNGHSDDSAGANNVNNNANDNTPEKCLNKSGSTAIRRRPGRRMDKSRIKRRCSINGHYYLRETSSFRPPYGSPCSIWITSKTTAEEVLNMLLEKYKVEMSTFNFALFIVKDTGELRRIKEDESPLVSRVMLGPHEDVAKVFIMDAQRTYEVSHEVAQFLNLSLTECRAILMKYEQEEIRHLKAIRRKYEEMRCFIQNKINKCSNEVIIPEFLSTPKVS